MKLTNKKIRTIVIISVLTIFGVITFTPFLWMFLSSFKTEAEVLQMPPTLFPHTFILDNYIKLFKEMDFGVYLFNTLVVVFFSFFGLLLNAMAGFAFAKYSFKGKKIMFMLVVATMMIPGQVTLIPVYLMLNKVSLTNTLIGIALPGLVGGFSIFLFKQFISNINEQILEAARLDGASERYIFFHVILPMLKPILAVQGILTFIAGWNSFLWPLILTNDQKYYTLSVGLSLLKGQHTTNYSLQMAASTFMVVPVLILFIIFQKYVINGFDISSDK